jgi:hypothetical protein
MSESNGNPFQDVLQTQMMAFAGKKDSLDQGGALSRALIRSQDSSHLPSHAPGVRAGEKNAGGRIAP